ncbi:CBS domain containing-hemolysin-like protein [Roseimicrobium gellanilyticum]|uniref:CBS domain containing-hemolysin-like protein n=1 Tax=Roseimicrobium gellanilyticum TaxID=748857 RepID=A0A366HR04_9BACT|nr:hemolysin family protein [Roseimicrobium gellanilyticum]RBP46095.1 CBS domain containing-hemolysin-like protein [Roseimicrobium gellanilyticum]
MTDLSDPASFQLLASSLVREWEFTTWDVLWRLGMVMFFVLLNGFFVAAEFAIVKVRESQLQAEAEEGNRQAVFAQSVVKHLDAYLSATQLGITLASIALGMAGEPLLAQMIEPWLFKVGVQSDNVVHGIAFGIAFTVITFLHVVLGELTPKSLAIRKSLPTTLWVCRPLHIFMVALKPFIFVLNGTANWLLKKLFHIDPVGESERVHSEEELKHIVAASEESDEVTETEKRIVLNALALNDRYVRDVMTPRKDVISLDVDEPFEVNLKLAIESKHTRFPLVEGHLDHSIGLVHIKDMLRLMQEPGSSGKDLRRIKRELLLVPEMMPVDKLLKQFLDKHAHLALAVDEYGGAVGIVTLDNVVEEIVGDIQDEFDTAEKPEFHRINDDEFDVEGTLNLYELNELTDLELESDEVTTISGYVTHALGHFPKQGETLRVEDYEVTATKVEARRIAQLHFKRVPKVDDEEGSESGSGQGEVETAKSN